MTKRRLRLIFEYMRHRQLIILAVSAFLMSAWAAARNWAHANDIGARLRQTDERLRESLLLANHLKYHAMHQTLAGEFLRGMNVADTFAESGNA